MASKQEDNNAKKGNETNEKKEMNFDFILNHFKSGYQYILEFNLHEKVSSTREAINSTLDKLPKLPNLSKLSYITTKGDGMIVDPIRNVSEEVNKSYPYFSSLCRSHTPLLITSAAVLAMVPLRSKLLLKQISYSLLRL